MATQMDPRSSLQELALPVLQPILKITCPKLLYATLGRPSLLDDHFKFILEDLRDHQLSILSFLDPPLLKQLVKDPGAFCNILYERLSANFPNLKVTRSDLPEEVGKLLSIIQSHYEFSFDPEYRLPESPRVSITFHNLPDVIYCGVFFFVPVNAQLFGSLANFSVCIFLMNESGSAEAEVCLSGRTSSEVANGTTTIGPLRIFNPGRYRFQFTTVDRASNASIGNLVSGVIHVKALEPETESTSYDRYRSTFVA